MQTLPTMSVNLEGKINLLIKNFIWNGRKPKIRMDVLQLSKANAGCKLGNLILRDKSLKIE